MKVYKILRRDKKKLKSWSPAIGCTQQYSTLKVNKPLILRSYMFVFQLLKDARALDMGCPGKEIWRCEAAGVNRKIKSRLDIGCNAGQAAIFWNFSDAERTIGGDPQVVENHAGVLLCKTLRLLKRVA